MRTKAIILHQQITITIRTLKKAGVVKQSSFDFHYTKNAFCRLLGFKISNG